jgi:hypothetical protein
MDIISRNVAKSTPNSLQEQRVLNSFLTDENATAETDQKNWLSLLTMQELDDIKDPALKKIATEETRYLRASIEALAGEAKSDEHKRAQDHLRTKFGRDLAGAVSLSDLLKRKADEEQTNQLLSSFVKPLTDVRNKERGGAFVENV